MVGRSGAMMTGYHNQPTKTAEAEWFDAEGRRYIRTGDVGRFDDDGFNLVRNEGLVVFGPTDYRFALGYTDMVFKDVQFGIEAGERDGIVVRNLLASYTHLRATGNCDWPARFVEFARSRRHAD